MTDYKESEDVTDSSDEDEDDTMDSEGGNEMDY
jgi:hypothetical protein